MEITTARLLGVGHLPPQPDWKMAEHWHRFHEMIVVLDGEIRVEMRGTTRAARAGEILWYPAKMPHREWTNPQQPSETIFISWEWPEPPAYWPLQQADNCGRITEIARWLYAERETGSALHAFLQAIVTEYDRLATYKDDPLVTSTRIYVRQHLAVGFDLAGLAQRVGLSKFHFVRRYKALTGRTPMEDARYIRLQIARDLLLTTALPLKEIAPRVGLGDEYRLCKLFRKEFHTTTARFRQRRS